MPTHSAPAHILVIEDDPDLRELFHELLADEGYCVSSRGTPAADIPGALASLAPDLIVTDSMGHAGESLTASLRSLRADLRLTRTPVILCTGAVRKLHDLDGAIADLGVRVVLKPFDIDHLLGVVAAALDEGS